MVGASAVPGKWGFTILFNILNGGFTGKIFPVNPREKSIMGLPCHASLMDIPEEIDAALIVTPAQAVPAVIDDCGARGIPYAIVITSNFSETGREGARLERIVIDKAREYGMHIVGPNTMGIFSANSFLHALMPTVQPLHGSVSMLSQSGNVGAEMLARGLAEGVGFAKFVSSGNEADITCVDYLRYFGEDEATQVILAYLEGVKPDADLLSVARSVSLQKPIIVVKGGRTRAGEKAAASHTGAMGGAATIYRGIFRQAGMIEVTSSQRLMDSARVFAHCPIPRGNRVAIITRGGGWGVMAADACEENGLVVPPLPQEIINEVDTLLPPYWSHGNPIDMVAVTAAEPFLKCMELLTNWDGVDAVITAGAFNRMAVTYSERSRVPAECRQAMAASGDDRFATVFAALQRMIAETGKPVIDVMLFPREEEKNGVPGYRPVSFPNTDRAVQALTALVQYGTFLKTQGAAAGIS